MQTDGLNSWMPTILLFAMRRNVLPIFVLLLLVVGSGPSLGVHAEASALITSLPGFNGTLPFELHTGYITVNETTQNNLFYYFVKSDTNPSTDPLVLWVTGGPGCSGFSALLYEVAQNEDSIGTVDGGWCIQQRRPLRVKVKPVQVSPPGLRYNPYAITKFASVIFIDSPTGTGFSYSESESDYETEDTKVVAQLYIFMKKWFELHSKYTTNAFYVSGDSYSGITVPALTTKIADGIESGDNSFNLKGYSVGNPITDSFYDLKQVPFAHGVALISDEFYHATQASCKGRYDIPISNDCGRNIDIFNELLSDINQQNVMENDCGRLWSPRPTVGKEMHRASPSTRLRSLLGFETEHLMSTPPPKFYCRAYSWYLSYVYMNNETVREALHVRNGTVGEWKRCSTAFNFTNDISSTVEYHHNLTRKGYRALVYSGDHDLVVPFIGTQQWIKTLNYTIIDDWHPWYVGDQVGGYTRYFENNLTYATIRGGGHTAPEYKPIQGQAMFQRWLRGEYL